MDNPSTLENLVARIGEDLHDPEAPALGVHVLSEFKYCPRAAIITLEQQEQDDGSEFVAAPALGGLPTHDIDRIREALAQIREELKRPICWNIGLGIAVLYLIMFGQILPALLVLSLAGYFTGPALMRLLAAYHGLRKRLGVAEQAEDKPPKWEVRQVQSIRWWSLIRAGFASAERPEAIVDQESRLAGKPWRVLQRGRKLMPVLRIHVEDEERDHRRQGRLRPQQFVRAAAYAYLMNRIERAEADWVIILFGTSDEGIAIPIEHEHLELFRITLQSAREFLRAYRQDPDFKPKPARESAPCIRCPFGKPRRSESESVFRGAAVVPFLTEAANGKLYHSTCGDRFRWIPPHERAETLGLTKS